MGHRLKEFVMICFRISFETFIDVVLMGIANRDFFEEWIRFLKEHGLMVFWCIFIHILVVKVLPGA